MFSPIRKPGVLYLLVTTMLLATCYTTFSTKDCVEKIEDASNNFNIIEENVSDANQALKFAALALLGSSEK